MHSFLRFQIVNTQERCTAACFQAIAARGDLIKENSHEPEGIFKNSKKYRPTVLSCKRKIQDP